MAKKKVAKLPPIKQTEEPAKPTIQADNENVSVRIFDISSFDIERFPSGAMIIFKDKKRRELSFEVTSGNLIAYGYGENGSSLFSRSISLKDLISLLNV